MNDGVAFLVPTTSRGRSWETVQDTYLYRIFCGSLFQHVPDFDITIYFAYDEDDKIYSDLESRLTIDAVFGLKFKIEWIPFKPDKGNVVRLWNGLAERAIEDGFEYLMIVGDDVKFPNDKGWLGLFRNNLRKNKNIGWSAGWSNNDQIATQFLIHKNHVEMFGWVFPPQLQNWYCDNWLNEIYPASFRYWRKDYPLLNCGGEPRYLPNQDKKLCDILLKRYRPILLKLLRENKFI